MASPAETALSSDDVLDLQRDAGNQAVTEAIQRDAVIQRDDSGSKVYPSDGDPLPTAGPDVRSALQARYPGLLRALTAAQLKQWQDVVDYHTVKRVVDSRYSQLASAYQGYYGVTYEHVGEFKAKRRVLERAVPRRPSEELSVDVRLLLADDVTEQPKWDVKAELAFRQWAVTEITKEPLQLSLRPAPDEALGQHPMPGIVHKTKGFVTARDLAANYPAEYDAWVSNREEMVKLRQALRETEEVLVEVRAEHSARSDKNAERIGFGAVRHVSEALGEGSAPYPTIRIWDRPRALIDQAKPLLAERKFEVAVPLIAMAEQGTAECAQRFMAYENRVMTGAGTAVKWLGRLKTAGSIAAGIASGGLGLTGSALVAGGYTLVQEGAGRMSEMHYGQREHFGVGSLMAAAGTSALMTLAGGMLQARFQVAIKARLERIPSLTGQAFTDRLASATAAATSSVYTTAAQTVLDNVISGKAFPKDAQELADMVVDGVVENVVMDVATAPLNARVTKEYQAWRAGKGKPPVTVPETARATQAREQTVAGGSDRTARPDATTHTAPAHLSEVAVRSLLREGGGWDRLHAELQSGTGLGSGLTVTERRGLVDRFEAHRARLARDAAAVFDGTVGIAEGPAGKQIEVRFDGPDAAQKVVQAGEYLDAKRPGWREDTSVRLATGRPGAQDAGVTRELAMHLQPAAQALAAEFIPLHADWAALTPMQRLQRMRDVVNRGLARDGVPPIEARFEPGKHWAHFYETRWELSMPRELFMGDHVSPADFAKACALMAHEARHAFQEFEALRTVTDRAELEGHIIPDHVLEAVQKAGVLDPATLRHGEAREWFESVHGTGRAHREEVLADLDKSVRGLREAQEALDRATTVEDRLLAETAMDTWRREFERVDPLYRALAEEVDAYDWQGHVQKTMHETFQKDYNKAIAEEQAAFLELRRLQALQADTRDKPGHTITIETRKDISRAFARLQQAIHTLERLEARLGKLKKPALPR